MTTQRPVIRAAIYTRKSSDEGLEQEFNSLDAQHEACSAFITSQRHEGWKAVPTRFDDGGISGGTLDRPALQRLMAEVDAGRIDMIVVYKIDRLTRSLADFARLVERLDRAGASLVSVTQAFNTSTSMGRLTLNVLLSFAQFEREVTAERIRDKIASSKQRGLWMGGTIPLGYDRHPDPQRRELVLNTEEAETVRTLFDLYDQHGSIRLVEIEAARLGLRSKRHETESGRRTGGGVFTRGQIHYLLTNPTYIGMVRHKARTYAGQHPAIIGRDLWDRVQARLLESRARPRVKAGGGRDGLPDMRHQTFPKGKGAEEHSGDASLPSAGAPGTTKRGMTSPALTTGGTRAPLLGLLFDETGDGLTPSRTTTGTRSYRYYVSNRLIAGGIDPTGWRLPAIPLEQEIAKHLTAHLRALAAQHRVLSVADARTTVALGDKVDAIADGIAADPGTQLPLLLARGRVHSGAMHLDLNAAALSVRLDVPADALAPEFLATSFRFHLRRRGIETKLVVGDAIPVPDTTMIRALHESHCEMAARMAGRRKSDASNSSKGSRARRRSYLAFLSPRIQQAILDGTTPEGLTLERLLAADLPMDWAAQERMLGFSEDAARVGA